MIADRKIEANDVFLRLPEKAGLDELVLARLRAARDKVSSFESEAQLHQSRLDTSNKQAVNAREEVLYWEEALARLSQQTESRNVKVSNSVNYSGTADISKLVQQGINARLPRTAQEPAQEEMFRHLDSDSPNEAPEPEKGAQSVTEGSMMFMIPVYDDTDIVRLQSHIWKATREVLQRYYTPHTYKVHDIENDHGHPVWEKIDPSNSQVEVVIDVKIDGYVNMARLRTLLREAFKAL